eukprot:CAMPEP_0177680388 /NCGR_PEP_ID=MMETSP0447-20121125/30145_1 /TAXON_ID=0 /ORGANISM="Stygamoeba regulata, Strain BSH-02190019" /LENGTH=263 /DNA_ID=CAMNT_0019189713 /DNA_START=124 /DNA_END=911 /DNA_ORIENTATION=-
MLPPGVISIVLILSIASIAHVAHADSPKVRLTDVKALVFRRGALTTGRRSAPVQQLTCVGGNACHVVLDSVMCQNVGDDGFDVTWKCQADMESKYRFGKVTVTCEGYDHPDDPFILRGSCGLEYELHSSDQGYHSYTKGYTDSYSSGGFFSNLFPILLIAFVAYILYSVQGVARVLPEGMAVGTDQAVEAAASGPEGAAILVAMAAVCTLASQAVVAFGVAWRQAAFLAICLGGPTTDMVDTAGTVGTVRRPDTMAVAAAAAG